MDVAVELGVGDRVLVGVLVEVKVEVFVKVAVGWLPGIWGVTDKDRVQLAVKPRMNKRANPLTRSFFSKSSMNILQ